ncbi:MAG TPA: ABC transporter ATP-binding protein [Tepidisphaeraceae bacterium]|nr:ABC transporter ATP-binding protein [Tepidisphaeraceae bacterium]
MSSLLSASGIDFAYGNRPVLRQAGLELSSGQIVALLGPNGSGKTTLIRALLGHLRASGTIQWEGRDLRKWNRREFARQVTYLPQSPTFEPQDRVIDVLRLGRAPYWQIMGIESSHDGEVIDRIAALLGLNEILNRRMDQLSGGQRQRIFLGRCLVQEPVAMLLDEPSTFLDLKYQVELGQLLRRLTSESKLAVLMASHDLNFAASLADQIMLLKDGAVERTGSPGDVLQADVLANVYGVEMDRIDHQGKPFIVTRI